MLDTAKISLTIQWDVVKLWWLSDKTNFGSAQHGIDWIGKQGGSGIHPGWNPMQVTPKIGLIMQWVALKRRSLCDKKLFTVKSNIQHRILSWIYPERHFLIPWNLDVTEKDQKLEIFKEDIYQ